MKKLLPCILLLSMHAFTYGQLSGNKYIPGDYTSIAAAISDINTSGVIAPGLTINIPAGYSETFASPLAGLITTVTSYSGAPIVFMKIGNGANPLVIASAGTGNMDAVFMIAGSDYVTFDGIDVLDPASHTTAATRMEWGYALVRASVYDGSQYITIKNCNISLQKANPVSVGIYSGNHTSSSTTSLNIAAASGTNSYNKFYNNNITNVNTGISILGSPLTSYYDVNNEIGVDGGNILTNFGAGSSNAYGIYADCQNGLKIANDSINGGSGTTGNVAGIYLNTGVNASVDVFNNSITLQPTVTVSAVFGISNGFGSGGVSNVVNIYNNVVQNINFTSAVSASLYPIYNATTPGFLNIYGNRVSGNRLSGSGSLAAISGGNANIANIYQNTIFSNAKTNAGGSLYCINVAASSAQSIHDNLIYHDSIIANSSSYTPNLYGIFTQGYGTSNAIYNNEVHELSVSGTCSLATSTIYGIYGGASSTNYTIIQSNKLYNYALSTTGGGTVYGLYALGGGSTNENISTNELGNFNTSGTANGTVIAVYIAGGSAINIYSNKLYHLYAAGSLGTCSGIYVSTAFGFVIYNNFISDLVAPVSTSVQAVTGLFINGGFGGHAFNNSIFLSTSSSGFGTFSISGIYASTSPTFDLKNNIIVNTSTPGPAGISSAYRRSSTTLSTYDLTSDNNCFYVGIPSSNRLIFYDGTNSIQTLSAYKTLMGSRETNSILENPPFVNSTTTPFDLHLQPNILTHCESGGVVVASPANVSADFDGDSRYPNGGYPDDPSSPATAPDIGADEFAGIHTDTQAPLIAYNPLPNTGYLVARTLTVTVSDLTGVPVNGAGLPVLYWKINSGSWNAATGLYYAPGIYTFSFGAGVQIGDIVHYYVVAQDTVAPVPNVGAFPSAGASGFTFNPPACSTPPGNASSYSIIPGIYGIASYANSQHTALNNVVVYVKDNQDILVDSTFTDSTGYYHFNTLPAGNYHLTVKCTKSWGGSNAADALLVLLHFTGAQILSDVYLLAADVNGTGTVNSVNALLIARRFVGQITSFAAGNWVFFPASFSFPTSNPEIDLQGLCTGDVNGSYVPVQ